MGFRETWEQWRGSNGGVAMAEPGPSVDAGQESRARALVEAYAAEADVRRAGYNERETPNLIQAGQEIMSGDAQLQLAALLVGAEKLSDRTKRGSWRAWVQLLCGQLLRRKLPFDAVTMALLTHYVALSRSSLTPSLLGVVEKFLDGRSPDDALRAALQEARAAEDADQFSRDVKVVSRIDVILEDAVQLAIIPGEAWSDLALADLASLEPGQQQAWLALVQLASKASGSKPSAKFTKTAEQLIGQIGQQEFRARLARWLEQIGKPGKQPTHRTFGYDVQLTNETLICDINADLLKGLVWASAVAADTELIRALGSCAEVSYKKIPGFGARCTKLANACVQTLAAIGTSEALGHIVRVRMRVKTLSAQNLIASALGAAAEKAGATPEELEESVVPTFGLDEDGVCREALGECTAEIVITGVDAELQWTGANGKPQASVPKSVKDEHAEDLKELKAAVNELNKALPAHRDRLEGLYLGRRSWQLLRWRQHYLDHPLMLHLARRLIWAFERDGKTVAGIWDKGQIVDCNDQSLEPLGDETRVTLWHPIQASAEQVLAWRNWLVRHEVTQPFKQAHREVYLLTDAERQTDTYSNRFAAHILRQHRFGALAQQRGWRYQLMGAWDSDNVPFRELPAWGLTAQFWVQCDATPDAQTSQAAIYLYLATDQVRFLRGDEPEPIALTDVPPLAFSEIMRDVDLFVGVASVGNDPEWRDTGPDGHRTYWQSYSFGELTATAQTRRQILTDLLPRLKIAERCRLEDRFLVVQGDLRTYKIHLGSGNILMSPNDQYLCIVQSRGGAAAGSGKVFLPFEGDGTLAVILSKALMLADDKKIKDATILRQIS